MLGLSGFLGDKSNIYRTEFRSQEEAVRWTGSPTCSNCRQLPFRIQERYSVRVADE
ncbi:hypothetical protein [Trichormus sp. NMC-1]|uniref:hypothetical protein n=1 Tax=Trichormus sp. NMC-1 TaxID=1853259 RepID=UPI0015A52D66|nr:hypothetical protein [Trichormus sp. NMC-1]